MAERTTNDKWEYRVERMSPSEDMVESRLSNLGSAGWEAFAVSVQFTAHFVWMKRQIKTSHAGKP